MKEYIRIREPEISNDNALVFKLLLSGKTEKYFLSDNLVFRYDVRIGNPAAGILQIPAVASVMTVALAIGADIYVDNLDVAYLKSLSKITPILKTTYPDFPCSTKIIVRNAVSNGFSNNGYGLLFSGGIDSSASYIRHRDKRPNLINVCGAGVDIQSYNGKIAKKFADFSRREQVELNFIETNWDRVLNRELLRDEFGLDWWVNVNHGLCLTGLCAPLTQVKNIRTLLIASSVTDELGSIRLSGSRPDVDNRISWADVNVLHDSYDVSRQGKIRHFLRNYIEETEYYPFIRVCTKSSSENCGRCEKCLRTITGLALEGIDPNKCGFHDVDRGTFEFVKASLINGNLIKRSGFLERRGQSYLRMADVFLWRDIQRHIPETISVSGMYGQFFRWFKDFDIPEHLQAVSMFRLPLLLLVSILQTLAPFNAYLPRSLRNIDRKIFRFLLK